MRPGAVIFDRISHLVSGSYEVTMGSDDGTDSELDKYAPKWVRESADLTSSAAAASCALHNLQTAGTRAQCQHCRSRGTAVKFDLGFLHPLLGPAKELGQHMKEGIEAAFNVANAKGGCTAASFGWSRLTTAGRAGCSCTSHG